MAGAKKPVRKSAQAKGKRRALTDVVVYVRSTFLLGVRKTIASGKDPDALDWAPRLNGYADLRDALVKLHAGASQWDMQINPNVPADWNNAMNQAIAAATGNLGASSPYYFEQNVGYTPIKNDLGQTIGHVANAAVLNKSDGKPSETNHDGGMYGLALIQIGY